MLVHQYTRLGSIRDRALRAAFRRAVERNDGFSEDMSRSRGRSASVPALFMAAQPRATCVPQLTRATWPIRGPPAEPAVRAETAENNKKHVAMQLERKLQRNCCCSLFLLLFVVLCSCCCCCCSSRRCSSLFFVLVVVFYAARADKSK